MQQPYMPTFFIEQFGCRATQADGAALERQLLDRGCAPAPTPAAADIIVINTCTVTASSDAQARDAIRKFHAAHPSPADDPGRPRLPLFLLRHPLRPRQEPRLAPRLCHPPNPEAHGGTDIPVYPLRLFARPFSSA